MIFKSNRDWSYILSALSSFFWEKISSFFSFGRYTKYKAFIWPCCIRKCRQGSRTWLGLLIVQFWELLPTDGSPALFLLLNDKLNSHQKQRSTCLQKKKKLTWKFTKSTSAFSTDKLQMLPWRWLSGFLLTHDLWHQVAVHSGCSSHTFFQLCSVLS